MTVRDGVFRAEEVRIDEPSFGFLFPLSRHDDEGVFWSPSFEDRDLDLKSICLLPLMGIPMISPRIVSGENSKAVLVQVTRESEVMDSFLVFPQFLLIPIIVHCTTTEATGCSG